MKMPKKLLSVLLAACMLLGVAPLTFASARTFAEETAAAVYARECMKQRNGTISFVFQAPADAVAEWTEASSQAYTAALMGRVFETVFAHTGVGNEGDYLRQHVRDYKYGCEIEGSSDKAAVNCTFTVTARYYTTAAEENKVAAAVKNALDSLELQEKSDYQKARAVTDYICDRVTYDDARLNDESYTLKYSAYAALVNGTAVCQGYASLFYRMALEAGLDARVITGRANGGAHAWNIVKVDGAYYSIDPTWIDGGKADCFLRGRWDFPDHSADEAYLTDSFLSAYPAAENKYALPVRNENGTVSGMAGDRAAWRLTPDGVLTVTGTGKIYDSFVGYDSYLSGHKEAITAIRIEEGITQIGDNAFDKCENAETLSLPESLETLGSGAFCFCLNLTSVVIPDRVTELPPDLFFSDYRITEIKLPKNLKKISHQALLCRGLGQIRIPASVETIEAAAFYAADLQYVFFEGTKAQWKKAVNYEDNDCLKTAKIFYQYSDEKTIVIEEGICGESGNNLTWKIDNHHTLTIEGNGRMKEYEADGGFFPWYGIMLGFPQMVDSIVLSEGVTSIGAYAFRSVQATRVQLPNSLTGFPATAFYENGSIREINIPDGFSFESQSSFNYLDALETITVSANCQNYTVDENGALFALEKDENGKDKLSLIVVPAACKTLFLPENTIWVVESAFKPARSLQEIRVENGNPMYYSENGILYQLPDDTHGVTLIHCPSQIDLNEYTCPADVTGIETYAFYNNRTLKKIVFPGDLNHVDAYVFEKCAAEEIVFSGSVSYFSHGCFQNCRSLKTVVLPNGITELTDTFWGCSALEQAQLPDSLTSIRAAFVNCKNLREITIPEGVAVIDDSSFYGCSSLEKVAIPDSVEKIERVAFYGCESLKEVTIPDAVKELGEAAFCECSALEKVQLPNSLETLSTGVFQECASLKAIRIPNTVKRIDNYAFYGCVSLTTVHIPASVETIGEMCFGGNAPMDLKAITVDAENRYYSADGSGNLYNKDKTELICYATGSAAALYVMPDSVQIIRERAICFASHLKTVVLSKHVTEITDQMFIYSPLLEDVYIPLSIKSINTMGFYKCSNLKHLYFEAEDLSGIDITTYDSWEDGTFERAEKIFNYAYHEHRPVTDAAVAATCTGDGKTEGSHCAVCGAVLKAQAVVKAAGHKWDAGRITKAASCTDNGVKTYTCTVCKAAKTETVKAAGHRAVTDKAVAASCTKDGKTEGSHCSVCGTVLKAQNTVKAAGHKWDAGRITKAATAVAEGEKTYTCAVCGETKNETIPKDPAKDSFLPGDVNQDGDVTAADARLALRAAVGLESYETDSEAFLAADANGDGEITAEDARSILRAAVGLEDPKNWVK